ncbi:hypothetical protein AWE51_15020 [Aquimarina aggregata]|uniref:Uncharacterized protein n=1 Tax=Aquimarina aggregata TaxID=1642818 RepID=A0A162Y223_9FLAO|nr:hypothetical protein [Aquimarina aggregata]KZS38890.1 hypothetical protein AWE51_15020 [Aquimarina aggregata]
MKLDFKNNEKKYINIYRQKGYLENYRIHKDQLVEISNLNTYSSKQVYVIAKYMFEDVNNPNDNSILYILKTSSGSKGLLLEDKATKNSSLTNFFDAIPNENIQYKENLF